MELIKMEEDKKIKRKIELSLGSQGNLCIAIDGEIKDVEVRPCFPWSNKASHLSLRDKEGVELGFISRLDDLSVSSQQALMAVLGDAQFCFDVTEVISMEEEFELRNWVVETKQGQRSFQTNLVDWPYTLPSGALVISDVGGDLYLLSDLGGHSKKSQKIVEAFLD